jgi:hypothetical protein
MIIEMVVRFLNAIATMYSVMFLIGIFTGGLLAIDSDFVFNYLLDFQNWFIEIFRWILGI